MRHILHVVTQPHDDLAWQLIRTQQTDPDSQITVADLTETEPDYPALLEAIFTADTIAVW